MALAQIKAIDDSVQSDDYKKLEKDLSPKHGVFTVVKHITAAAITTPLHATRDRISCPPIEPLPRARYLDYQATPASAAPSTSQALSR